MNKRIYILLATYNGEKYLNEQIDSLLKQTYKYWVLWVHDDNSTDNTVSILKEYRKQYTDKIKLLDDSFSAGGAKENFTYLLNNIDHNYDYIMFCDQDDIWFEDRIEIFVNRMKGIECDNQFTPVLIHSDLTLVDESLSLISDSFFKYQKINPEWSKEFELSLVQNSVTGCAMMINKQAKVISLPIGRNAIMHDWWILLKILQKDGIVEYLDVTTIFYRQHSLNDIGARGFSWLRVLTKTNSLKKYQLMSKDLGLNLSLFKIMFIKARRFLWY
tara:strand:- start:25530 stop:26348 length:819 start_codon:yes stop_codon:yes gene_type:complete